MEQFNRTVKEYFADKKKRDATIVGAGIAVAAIAGIITLTTYTKREKKKK